MAPTDSDHLQSLPSGYRAVVIGASGGIGGAICGILRAESGMKEVVELSRSRDGFDIENEDSVAWHARSMAGNPIHLLICATGILTTEGKAPEKSLRTLDPEIMMKQFRTNAIGPALVMKHFLPLLDRQSRTISAFLSARVGSIGDNRLGGWFSYRASKAAMNQMVRTASIEIQRTHREAVVVAIHPGTVRTALSDPYSSGHFTVGPDEAGSNILRTLDKIPASRSGSFFAYDGAEISW